MSKFTVLTVVLAVLPRVALAQAPAAPAPPPPLREGSAEFAFVGTTGNAPTQSIGLGGELIYRPAPWETKFKVNYVRNEADQELKAETLVLVLRAQRLIRPRLSGFGQYGYQHDEFAGILARNVIEGGLSYVAVDAAPHKLTLDGALGYTNEDRPLDVTLSTATASASGLYSLKLSETSEITEEGRFVFSLSDGDDWRYANVVALSAKVTTVFSLKASNTIRYLHLPATGFKTTDTITAIALVAKF